MAASYWFTMNGPNPLVADQFGRGSFQVYRGAVPGIPGNRLQLLGIVGESCGFDCYDDHILHGCLSEAPLHQEVYIMCGS